MSKFPSYLGFGSDSDSSPTSSVASFSSNSSLSSRSENGLQLIVNPNELHDLPPAAQRLPAAKRIDRIKEAIEKNRVVCVVGQTGSGKSTVIPFALANAKPNQKILVSQPRRMAAISLSDHVQNTFYGPSRRGSVGYRVRAQRTDTEESNLVYVTSGYLKTLLTHEPDDISKFSHLILDEVHERGIDSDFLSLIVKRLLLLPENSQTKLIVMSATLESNLFVEYFRDLNGGMQPPTVELTSINAEAIHPITEYFIEDISGMFNGRFFPEVHSCVKTFENALTTEPIFGVLPGELYDNVMSLAVDMIVDLTINNQFSTLVFLPGLGEILTLQEKILEALERRGEIVIPVETFEDDNTVELPSSGHYYHIFILHSTMPYEEQRRAIVTPRENARHIVLSTNVAESSLTVPNVNLVIDSGLKRTNSYDPKNRVYRLTTVWCSRASCLQRRGRTGRVCSGVYVKLFTEEFYRRQMAGYDTPEVLLSDLSCVFLNAKYISEFWRLPDAGMKVVKPSEILCELITPPRNRSVKAAILDLFEAGILRIEPDEMSELSLLGTLATRLHVEPQIARILYFGWMMGIVVYIY